MIEQVAIIQPGENLDASKSQEFRDEITSLLNGDCKTVLVDFQNVKFMDSSGLGALVLAFKTLRAAERRMVVCSINEQVRILFELTGMDKVFEIFTSRDEFQKALLSGI